jgi:DNA-binding HxlR family transcriptional regulator
MHILKLIPEQGEMSSKELTELAKYRKISSATLFKHLAELVATGVVRRRIKMEKEKLKHTVYYSRTNATNLELELYEILASLHNLLFERSAYLEFERQQERRFKEAKTYKQKLKIAKRQFWITTKLIELSHNLLFETHPMQKLYKTKNLYVGLFEREGKAVLHIKPIEKRELDQLFEALN